VTLTGAASRKSSPPSSSPQIFDTLGVAPMLGRGFASGEDQDAPRTMILSHAAWLRQFGGDAAADRALVTINGEPVTIVGIMPRSFEIFGLPRTSTCRTATSGERQALRPQPGRHRAAQARHHAQSGTS
jgi:hypothetical protein